jgi:hypothetical protein
MLDLFNTAKPQGCDIQTFYGNINRENGSDPAVSAMWTKPRGVSHVYMLLCGAGGKGNAGVSGGGSGAVTVWYGAAQNVPDSLQVYMTYAITRIYDVQASTSGGASLLFAASATGGTGGPAMTANQFAASGFFQSTAGGAGSTSGNAGTSATNFLGLGTLASGATASANYGYSTLSSGFFMTRPIIVGCGGAASGADGGVGSGGNDNGKGGPNFCLIASW